MVQRTTNNSWAQRAIACIIVILAWAAAGQAAHHDTPAGKTAHAVLGAVERSYISALADMGRSRGSGASFGQQRAQRAFVKQMKVMSRFSGPEQRARVIRMLEFQRGLLRWATPLIFLPTAEAAGQTQYWLHGTRADLIAALFSKDPRQRIAAAKQIAKMKGWQADDAIGNYVLSMLPSGNFRLVQAAVNILRYRKPTRDMVEAACRLLKARQQAALHVWVTVDGKPYRADIFPTRNWQQATELLLHILAQWHLRPYRNLINDQLAIRSGPIWAGLCDTRSVGVTEDLLLKLKPPGLARHLIRLIHSSTALTNVTPEVGYFDGHTAALYVLLKLSGKNPLAFHFQKIKWYDSDGLWTESSRQDQNAAIRAITAWYARHGVAKTHPAWWDAPAAPPTESAIRAMATRSEKMQAAGLSRLDSDNFQTRRDASRLLKNAIVLQMRTMFMIAGKTNFQHAWYLLQDEEGFTAWMLWAMHGLHAEQKRRLAWGFARGNQQLAADAFSHDSLSVTGATQLFLERRQDPQAMAILNSILHRRSEFVFLHAADTVMRIGPTDAMADALYRACVPHNNLANSMGNVKLRHESYPIVPITGPLAHHAALDAGILVRWKPHVLARLITATANRWLLSSEKAKVGQLPIAWNRKWRAFAAIFSCCPPRSAVQAFVQILRYRGVPRGAGGGLITDDRQPLLYLLAQASGKGPAAMGMVKSASTDSTFPWAFRSVNQEQAVITRVCAWWKAHPNGPAGAAGNQAGH